MSENTDNLSEKIANLLNDPDSIEQIKSLGSMLGLNTDNIPELNTPNKQNKEETQDFTNFSNINIPPEILSSIGKILPVLSSVESNNSPSAQLLKALRPFLSDKRKKKLDASIKLLAIIKILPTIKNSGVI